MGGSRRWIKRGRERIFLLHQRSFTALDECLKSLCELLQSLLTFELLRRSTAPVAVMDFSVMLLSFLLVSPSWSRGAVITGVSEKFVAHVLDLKLVIKLI